MSSIREQVGRRPGGGSDWRVVGPGRSADRVIAELASRQFGVVSRRQLLELGIGSSAIANRMRQLRLHPIHRGVYLVGHPVAPEGAAEFAAVLACGLESAVSHRSAAFLWSITSARPETVEISLARTTGVRRPGIRIHRTTTLEPQDLRKLDGIPLTSPARTLLDLGTVLRPSALERALAQAETKRLVRRTDLVALLGRHGGRPGAGPLRALLEAEAGPAFTRSEAERKLLELVRAAELPSPKTNARLGAFEVDFLWPRHRLVVEVDGYRFHSQRSAFERDRRRDAELTRRGFTVIRVTWRQLVDEPHAVVARIAAALALASG